MEMMKNYTFRVGFRVHVCVCVFVHMYNAEQIQIMADELYTHIHTCLNSEKKVAENKKVLHL